MCIFYEKFRENFETTSWNFENVSQNLKSSF